MTSPSSMDLDDLTDKLVPTVDELVEAARVKLDEHAPTLERVGRSVKSFFSQLARVVSGAASRVSDEVEYQAAQLGKAFTTPPEDRLDHPAHYFRYSYARINEILADEMCPCAFLDLETYDANLDWLGAEMGATGKTIRIGTKSLRVPGLIKRAHDRPFVDGVFLFHPNEIAYLQAQYGMQDFLLAYPVMNRAEADVLCAGIVRDPATRVHVMADSPAHLHLLDRAARAKDVTLGVIVDCDFSVEFVGQFAGVYRSPLQTPAQVVSLAKQVRRFSHLEFRGIMGYEAQEAGIGDYSLLLRKMKDHSRETNNRKRTAVVEALTDAGLPPAIVNGGGSGCFQETAAEEKVTEVTIGSGLFKSYIFDPIASMAGFAPSLFMALRIVRFPRPGIATAYSGGYVCSAINKSPKVVLPEGVTETAREGFGEVQTPVTYDPDRVHFKHGDLLICRLAKAGEPMERFNEVVALAGGKIVERYPTYRGAGLWLG